MARYDRGVAQSYASRKRKKRVAPGRPLGSMPGALDAAASVEDLDDDLVASSTSAGPRPTVRIARAPVVEQRRATSRRSFADYAEEYRYVVGDLRRLAVVALGLLVLLVALSFVLG